MVTLVGVTFAAEAPVASTPLTVMAAAASSILILICFTSPRTSGVSIDDGRRIGPIAPPDQGPRGGLARSAGWFASPLGVAPQGSPAIDPAGRDITMTAD